LPTGGFRFKLLSAFSRQPIELRFTPSLGLFPIGSKEAAIFQAVQRGVERTFRNLNDATRYLLEPLSDCVSVDSLKGNGLEN
jgi:hypothetical protein